MTEEQPKPMRSAEDRAIEFEQLIVGVDFWHEVDGRAKLIGLIDDVDLDAFEAGRKQGREEAMHMKDELIQAVYAYQKLTGKTLAEVLSSGTPQPPEGEK